MPNCSEAWSAVCIEGRSTGMHARRRVTMRAPLSVTSVPHQADCLCFPPCPTPRARFLQGLTIPSEGPPPELESGGGEPTAAAEGETAAASGTQGAAQGAAQATEGAAGSQQQAGGSSQA